VTDFLREMARSSRSRTADLRPASELRSRAAAAPPPRPLELNSFDLIAEVKMAGPIDGTMIEGGPEEAARIAGIYLAAGAAAVSVLTEPTRFAGSISHLEEVSSRVPVPVMRKDFITHPMQVVEARAAGASGVLLVARLVDSRLLEELVDTSLDLGMFALVEVFDRLDLEAASTVFDRPVLLGVNKRDLKTLLVNNYRMAELAPFLPDHLPLVAESGITSTNDARRAAELGYRLILVGTALVTSKNPLDLARALIESGRSGTEP